MAEPGTEKIGSGERALSYARMSYSQFGEDGILAWVFPTTYPQSYYIDVGCHHPFRFSNTALLRERGWSGLNIDADERAMEEIRAHRPKDINVCMGVAREEGAMELAIFAEGAINTFAAEHAINPAFAGVEHYRRSVKVAPLGKILRDHWPRNWTAQFMNIDAEGMDYDVIVSNDWELCRPYCIAVEDDTLDLHDVSKSRTFNLLEGCGYRLLSHAAVTSIYALLGR